MAAKSKLDISCKQGVIVPALARSSKDGNGYELIAGHRRKAASNCIGGVYKEKNITKFRNATNTVEGNMTA